MTFWSSTFKKKCFPQIWCILGVSHIFQKSTTINHWSATWWNTDRDPFFKIRLHFFFFRFDKLFIKNRSGKLQFFSFPARCCCFHAGEICRNTASPWLIFAARPCCPRNKNASGPAGAPSHISTCAPVETHSSTEEDCDHLWTTKWVRTWKESGWGEKTVGKEGFTLQWDKDAVFFLETPISFW